MSYQSNPYVETLSPDSKMNPQQAPSRETNPRKHSVAIWIVALALVLAAGFIGGHFYTTHSYVRESARGVDTMKSNYDIETRHQTGIRILKSRGEAWDASQQANGTTTE